MKKNYLKLNESKIDLLNFIMVFCLITLNLSSLILTTKFSNAISPFILLAIIIIIFLIKSFIQKDINILMNPLILAFILIVFILLSMLVNRDYDVLNFVIIIQILCSVLVISIIPYSEFVDYYIKIIFLLCLYSLIIIYIFTPLFSGITNLLPIRANSSGALIRDFGLGFQFISENLSHRNTGIFREMGVYSIYVNLAIIFMLFGQSEKMKMFYFLVFIITIVTTLSTTGIIQLFFILIAFAYDRLNQKQIKSLLYMILITFIIFMIMSFMLPEMINSIETVLNKFNRQSGSYIGRVGSITANLKIWIKNPMFGIGIVKGMEETLNYLQNITLHNTSTTTSYMAMFGTLFSILLNLPLVLYFLRLKTKFASRVIIMLSFYFSINSQRIITDQFMYVMYFLLFMKSNNNKEMKYYSTEIKI